MAEKHRHGPEDATWAPEGGIPAPGTGDAELVEWHEKHLKALTPTLEVAKGDSVAEQRKAAAAERRSSDAPAGRSSKPHTTT